MATANVFVERVEQVEGVEGCILISLEGATLGCTLADPDRYSALMLLSQTRLKIL